MFNTLRYAKKLETAGVDRKQAEAHIQIISEIFESDLATRQDLREMEYRLILKLSAIMGTMFTVASGLIVAVLKS